MLLRYIEATPIHRQWFEYLGTKDDALRFQLANYLPRDIYYEPPPCSRLIFYYYTFWGYGGMLGMAGCLRNTLNGSNNMPCSVFSQHSIANAPVKKSQQNIQIRPRRLTVDLETATLVVKAGLLCSSGSLCRRIDRTTSSIMKPTGCRRKKSTTLMNRS